MILMLIFFLLSSFGKSSSKSSGSEVEERLLSDFLREILASKFYCCTLNCLSAAFLLQLACLSHFSIKRFAISREFTVA